MGSKILNIIKKIEEGILFLFLAVILLACFFQVIGRYTPLPFSSAFEEIAVNLFIWMTLLGAGVCVRTHSHMRMDIIDTFLPEKIKIFFFMKEDVGSKYNVNIYAPEMDNEGNIDIWPEGFFDEWDNALAELF